MLLIIWPVLKLNSSIRRASRITDSATALAANSLIANSPTAIAIIIRNYLALYHLQSVFALITPALPPLPIYLIAIINPL